MSFCGGLDAARYLGAYAVFGDCSFAGLGADCVWLQTSLLLCSVLFQYDALLWSRQLRKKETKGLRNHPNSPDKSSLSTYFIHSLYVYQSPPSSLSPLLRSPPSRLLIKLGTTRMATSITRARTATMTAAARTTNTATGTNGARIAPGNRSLRTRRISGGGTRARALPITTRVSTRSLSTLNARTFVRRATSAAPARVHLMFFPAHLFRISYL
ncbi:hypothetical protein EDD85DRAFT_217687 [Armillaria nabsnona]|nr:hypothetical protein EDD85DRAFT_217687 [Armillaria nabsnona]